MYRRGFLTALAAATAGCVAAPADRGVDRTVADPPDALHERGGCPDDEVVASLTLQAPTTDVPDDGVRVVGYDDLHPESRVLVGFTIDRGSAVACDDAGHFQQLLHDLTERGRYPHREGRDRRLRAVFVRVDGEYYELERLTVYDQVLE